MAATVSYGFGKPVVYINGTKVTFTDSCHCQATYTSTESTRPTPWGVSFKVVGREANKALRELAGEALAKKRKDRHSSFYIPPYFLICGESYKNPKIKEELAPLKVPRNVRPKGTHTHRKFYR